MKVRDLIQELSQLNPEAVIILSSDSEGNSYSPLSGLEACYYEPDTTWSGFLWDDTDEEAPEDEYDREDNTIYPGDEIPENIVPAVVIWPIS